MKDANDTLPPGARGEVWRGSEGWRTSVESAAPAARRRATGDDWERRGMDTIGASGKDLESFAPSDARVREQVCAQLEQSELDAREIGVAVENGEVTLDGHVVSRSAKRLAEDIVTSCHGVRACHNRLRV